MPAIQKIARDSEEVKIFVVLPFAWFVAGRRSSLLLRTRIALGFAAFELHVIVDEGIAEGAAEQRLLAERVEGFGQALRQQRAFGGIRLVTRGRQRNIAFDAGQAGDNL